MRLFLILPPAGNLKAECSLTHYGTALAIYDDRIWSFTLQGVESYDPQTDTWQTEFLLLSIANLGLHGHIRTNFTSLVEEFQDW